MKSIDLVRGHPQLSELIELAQREPVLLLAPNGNQFILSEADDFEAEVEALRNSEWFQRFLDERMQDQTGIPIEQIEREIDEEIERA